MEPVLPYNQTMLTEFVLLFWWGDQSHTCQWVSDKGYCVLLMASYHSDANVDEFGHYWSSPIAIKHIIKYVMKQDNI